MSPHIDHLPQKAVSLRFLETTSMYEYKYECLEWSFTHSLSKMTVVVYPLLPTLYPVSKPDHDFSPKNECPPVEWAYNLIRKLMVNPIRIKPLLK